MLATLNICFYEIYSFEWRCSLLVDFSRSTKCPGRIERYTSLETTLLFVLSNLVILDQLIPQWLFRNALNICQPGDYIVNLVKFQGLGIALLSL